MTMLFLNLGYETVEIVEFRIFGGCAVVEGRQGNVRTAERQGHRRLVSPRHRKDCAGVSGGDYRQRRNAGRCSDTGIAGRMRIRHRRREMPAQWRA